MLNSQPSLCCTVTDGKVSSTNQKFRSFFEIEENEILRKKLELRDFVSTFKEEWIDARIKYPDTPYKVELYKNGKNYIFDTYLSLSYYDTSYIYVVTMLDVSEIEELKKRELAQAKTISIGELSMGLTHEVNTPLTYIKGNIDLIEMDISFLEDKKLVETLQENIDAVRDGVDRINSIVELLKEYSSNSLDLDSNCNIYEAIVNGYKLISGTAQYISPIYLNGERLSMNYKPKETLFKCIEKRKLEQVILILFQNSLDELKNSSIPYDKRYIEVTIENYKDGKTLIEVKDNGGGITEKLLPKIFEPFVSGKPQSGMGLGLNIAKKIINEHAGEIYAENFEAGASVKILF
jgi:signal transduction histidine kinase